MTGNTPLYLRRPERFFAPGSLFRLGTLLAFLLSFIVYCLTIDPSASWWDCPEYTLVAYRLEIGHSPGNPTWMLFHNVVARMAGALFGVEKVALALNLCSALFTALSAALLFQINFFVLRYMLRGRGEGRALPVAIASLAGAMCLGWADSPWFSAVETEVYAMSLFFTAMMFRVMISWARTADRRMARRKLILLAYITGLSVGVHELNMLALPSLALIYVFRRNPYRRCTGRAWIGMILAAVALGSLLYGIYPGTAEMAALFELWAVNKMGLPFNSGVTIYLVVLLVAIVTGPMSLGGKRGSGFLNAAWRWVPVFVQMLLCAPFFYGGNVVAALSISAVGAALLVRVGFINPGRARTLLWMLSFTVLGFSTYLIIPLRSAQMPPINEVQPSDVFSYLSYLKRDQYGKKPIFYGNTPYSKPMYMERIDTAGRAVYDRVARKKLRPAMMPCRPGAVVNDVDRLLTGADSAANRRVLADAAQGRDRYITATYRNQVILTPELNMLLPRLASRSERAISNYESWAGMKKEDMDTVRVSYALDSLGQPVGRLVDGVRTRELSRRPTWMQNLRELFGYQVGFMYFRYLLWNYAGRQNDYPTVGEVEHGNFVTGIAPLDNAIYGDQDMMPAELGRDNAGRNVFYMIPLFIGIAGAIVALRRGRRGKRADAAVLVLFLMTGLAIVAFLNQDPGEARERDYSFLGSFLAFCIWIAMGFAWILGLAMRGAAALARRKRGAWGTALKMSAAAAVAAIPVWMLIVNYADHDRTGRSGPTDYAANILGSLDKDAIIFVDGDNFTFPLWYVQEVLGVRRDVTVINLSYLTTAWYVTQLMQHGEESLPVAMTATPAQIAYESFNMIRQNRSFDSDSIHPADYSGELRRIFTHPDEIPRFSRRWMRIPVAGGDSLRIDIQKVKPGGGSLTLRETIMIDILANCHKGERPRPVYWQDGLLTTQLAGMAPHTSRTLYARKYTPLKDPSDSTAYLCDEAMRYLPEVKAGGADRGIYADPYVGRMIATQRLSLLRLSDALLRQGRPADALRVARMIKERFPAEAYPYQALVEHNGVLWKEGLKLAALLQEAGALAGDTAAIAEGRALQGAEERRIESWRRWHRSLKPWQRETLSRETLLLIKRDSGNGK